MKSALMILFGVSAGLLTNFGNYHSVGAQFFIISPWMLAIPSLTIGVGANLMYVDAKPLVGFRLETTATISMIGFGG